MIISREDKDGFVEIGQVRAAVAEFFAQNDYAGKRILLIIPDNTRSGPVGDVLKIIYEQLRQKAKAVDCLVALGTHQPMSEGQICSRLAMTRHERKTKYASVKFFNHQWDKPEAFTSIGRISADEVEQISDG